MSLGGADIDLRAGALTAAVTEVGGGLRYLRDGGLDLVLDYPADTVRPKYAGSLLAPWPNRLADGRYAFDDETHQLPLTEPERLNALHGLVCWDRFTVRSQAEDRVTLGDTIVPRDGYPFEVDVEVAYVLDEDGLSTRVTAFNAGRRPAPWGTGPHPYLVAGEGPVDTWELTLEAAEVLEVTPDRLLPVGLRAVDGSPLDFRGGRVVGDTEVDHAFTGLAVGGDGLARVTVRGPDGRGVACSWDPGRLPWVQAHTADYLEPARRRRALAIEPMTCPPDAFNSGTDLVTLAPGDRYEVGWRIAPLR